MFGKNRDEMKWMVVAAASAALASAVVNRATAAGWTWMTDTNPPDSVMAKPRRWGRALTWTAFTAGAAAIASLVAQEGAAFGWKKATGKRPPRKKSAA